MKVERKEHVMKVSDCPRCGEDHESMTFAPLSGEEGTYFGWCLNTSAGMEPVLVSGEELGL